MGGWQGAGWAPGHGCGVATGAGTAPVSHLRVRVGWGGKGAQRAKVREQRLGHTSLQEVWESQKPEPQSRGPPRSLPLAKPCALTAITVGVRPCLAALGPARGGAALRGAAGGQPGPPCAPRGVDAHQCCLGGKRGHLSLPWGAEGGGDGDGWSQRARSPGEGTGSPHGSPLAMGTLHMLQPPLNPAPHTLTASPAVPAPLQSPKSRGQSRIPAGRSAGRTLCQRDGARGCARGVTPCWPPSPRSRCRSLGTRCAAPAEARGQQGRCPAPRDPLGVLAGGDPQSQGLTLRGPCWVAALPVPLLRRDRGTRGGPGTPRAGLAEAGGSSAAAGDGWPRVSPRFGGPLGGSVAALLSGRCLWGRDGEGMMGQSNPKGEKCPGAALSQRLLALR